MLASSHRVTRKNGPLVSMLCHDGNLTLPGRRPCSFFVAENGHRQVSKQRSFLFSQVHTIGNLFYKGDYLQENWQGRIYWILAFMGNRIWQGCRPVFTYTFPRMKLPQNTIEILNLPNCIFFSIWVILPKNAFLPNNRLGTSFYAISCGAFQIMLFFQITVFFQIM